MVPLSVVIITRNEEHNIADCIRSAKLVTSDIIVIDSGSDDNTLNLARASGASVFSIHWMGYGSARNFGAANASHDWILALDADERISRDLASSIRRLKFCDSNCIYYFRRKNYLGNQEFRLGTLGFETVKRIYNRKFAQWDLTLVHEKLDSLNPSRKLIPGYIDHYSFRNGEDYKAKAVLYAQMSAEKYFLQGRKTNVLKRYLSPLFNAAKSYFFLLGFLEGQKGWISAKAIAYYSWLKYFYLQRLLKGSRIRNVSFTPKTVKRA